MPSAVPSTGVVADYWLEDFRTRLIFKYRPVSGGILRAPFTLIFMSVPICLVIFNSLVCFKTFISFDETSAIFVICS
jgi:hypothetical protein